MRHRRQELVLELRGVLGDCSRPLGHENLISQLALAHHPLAHVLDDRDGADDLPRRCQGRDPRALGRVAASTRHRRLRNRNRGTCGADARGRALPLRVRAGSVRRAGGRRWSETERRSGRPTASSDDTPVCVTSQEFHARMTSAVSVTMMPRSARSSNQRCAAISRRAPAAKSVPFTGCCAPRLRLPGSDDRGTRR